MAPYLDENSAATRVRILRDSYKGAILLVEGASDCRLFNRLGGYVARTVTATGKDNVLCALKTLRTEGYLGLIAIVDADYWVLEGWPHHEALVTDTHDIETLILKSPALEKIISKFLIDEDRLSAKDCALRLRTNLLKCGLPLGCLRWESERSGLGLNFKTVDPWQFVNPDNFSLRQPELIEKLTAKPTGKARITRAELRTRAQALLLLNQDPWMVCQGHDLCKLLAMMLPLMFGRQGAAEAAEPPSEVRASAIEARLRAAYELASFKKTRLYKAIREWESSNRPYVVLARDEQQAA